MPKTIWVYNQNCVMAGKQVPQRFLDEIPEGEFVSGDYHQEEVSEENAEWHDQADNGGYHANIARTIRECLE